MKLMTYSFIGMALSFLAVSAALSQTSSGDASFRSFLPQFEAGTNGFINGDPTLWKKNASHRDDVTIMGGWGGLAKGWTKVDPWYDWAAARFRESGAKVSVEYISSEVSGNLAYTVAIERSEALVVGQDKPATMALRVTHVFRMEDGAWKLVHRHADPLIDKTAPAAVLQK
ncbi:MAG TPA: nuclear transport factor 2 family protein [Blastocatellia bacterium]|jgi:ketosteroid isomerase-like protein|nr:nuclear transport factor 2 family protein [Blastocatellia bacterium]